jgi:hypothetical protein
MLSLESLFHISAYKLGNKPVSAKMRRTLSIQGPTDTDLANEIFKFIPTEHLPKYLFRVLEPSCRFCISTTVLLTEFVILVAKVFVG